MEEGEGRRKRQVMHLSTEGIESLGSKDHVVSLKK